MFRLQVERRFTAKHAIVIEGELEELHEHDWRVRVRVQGPRLVATRLLVGDAVRRRYLYQYLIRGRPPASRMLLCDGVGGSEGDGSILPMVSS